MDKKLTTQDLVNAVNGDMAAFLFLREQPHAAIRRCRDALPELVLPAQAVRRMLTALQAGRIGPEMAQSWASFVRRGYIAGADDRPLLPIDIQYDPSAEEEIVEVVSRLDELGDAIDGKISSAESEGLIRSLSG
ncbi:MAG: hypothetical protein M3Q65_15565 [Chloroflexota bacterium]|nr:hypothetical protein [Chloroflexota bacterium]